MFKAFGAFFKSFGSLFSIKLLIYLMIPILILTGLWSFIIYSHFNNIREILVHFLSSSWIVGSIQEPIEAFLAISLNSLLLVFATILIIVFLMPLIYGSLIFVFSLIMVPFVIGYLHQKNYSSLVKNNSEWFYKSLFRTLKIYFIYLIAYFLLLPLWLIPGVQIILPIALNAWLNKNIMVEEILSLFTNSEEINEIHHKEREAIGILAVLTSVLFLIPVLQILAPMILILSYGHLLLNSLAQHRKAKESLV